MSSPEARPPGGGSIPVPVPQGATVTQCPLLIGRLSPAGGPVYRTSDRLGRGQKMGVGIFWRQHQQMPAEATGDLPESILLLLFPTPPPLPQLVVSKFVLFGGVKGWGQGGHSTTVCHVTFEVEGSCG